MRVARGVAVLVPVADVGDAGPIGRPPRGGGRSRAAGQALRSAAGTDRQYPDIAVHLVEAGRRPVGDERELVPARRPGGVIVVPIPVGELLRLAAVDPDDEKMAAPYVEPTGAVVAGVKARDDLRRVFFDCVAVLGLLPLPGFGDEGELVAI